MSYGIYLDNMASCYNVSHNVVANVEDAAFFFHDGRDNHVANNVQETPYVLRFFSTLEARISVSLGPDSGSVLGTE